MRSTLLALVALSMAACYVEPYREHSRVVVVDHDHDRDRDHDHDHRR